MNPRNPQVIQKLFKKQKPNQSEFEEEYLSQESERNVQSKRENQEGWRIKKKNDERSQEQHVEIIDYEIRLSRFLYKHYTVSTGNHQSSIQKDLKV